MLKLGVFFALLALSAAAPSQVLTPSYLGASYAVPLASSSQSYIKNYNALGAAPLAYSGSAAYAAPATYSAPVAYSAPAAYSSYAYAPAYYI